MAETTEDPHVPYNTTPMEGEDRFKEIDRVTRPAAVEKAEKTPFEKQKKNAKKSNKKKAKMAGGDEPT